MALLHFDAVTKTFPGPVTALDRFTLAIADRELVVIVGPSGSGKTTALRIVAGLERPTSGSIQMDGRTINDWRPKDRDVAMVFQQPALYPHLTVRGNAAFSLRMRGATRNEIDRRIIGAAAQMGLTSLLDRKPDTLSSGQAQRAAILRAIVRQPKCLLLDEPFASLDAPLRLELRGEFRAAHRRDSTTTLFVTHDQDEALALAERLVVLHAGKIEQSGTAAELYEQPANRFVAGFLGSPAMNFLVGRLLIDNDQLWFDFTGSRLAVADSRRASLSAYAGQNVVLGVRPAHFTLTGPQGAPPDSGSLDVLFQEREYFGDRWIVRATTNGGQIVTMIAASAAALPPGASMRWYLDTERAHYFARDAEGRNLARP